MNFEFYLGIGNEYTEELCKKFSDNSTFKETIKILSPSVIEFLNCATSLSWKGEMHSDTFETLLTFTILNLEVNYKRIDLLCNILSS